MLCSVVIRGVGLVEYSLGDFSRGEAYLERLLKIVDPVAPRPGLEHTMLAATVPWVARITGVFNQLDVAATDWTLWRGTLGTPGLSWPGGFWLRAVTKAACRPGMRSWQRPSKKGTW